MHVAREVKADYLVVGAGAMGMAFVDALVGMRPGVRVAMVERRHGPGGHWREAYPFVRLHQASTFYGVASTLLGGGHLQAEGPEAGLHERADQPTGNDHRPKRHLVLHHRRGVGRLLDPPVVQHHARTIGRSPRRSD